MFSLNQDLSHDKHFNNLPIVLKEDTDMIKDEEMISHFGRNI